MLLKHNAIHFSC